MEFLFFKTFPTYLGGIKFLTFSKKRKCTLFSCLSFFLWHEITLKIFPFKITKIFVRNLSKLSTQGISEGISEGISLVHLWGVSQRPISKCVSDCHNLVNVAMVCFGEKKEVIYHLSRFEQITEVIHLALWLLLCGLNTSPVLPDIPKTCH